MIILTQPGISSFNPSKVSSTVMSFGINYCLAEVNDDFVLSERQMKKAGIDFWWAVTGSQLDASFYKLRKYKGGLISGIIDQVNVSKEINIAYAIYSIAEGRKADEFQIWERSISKS